jgi:tyrosyl-tRNA synthetase
MDSGDKFNLIVDGLDEVIGEQELINIIKERDLKLYWGTAPTGKPHIGYLKPLFKICQFLKAGCDVTILFADLHAYLDAMKSSWAQLKFRTIYYQDLITETLKVLGAPIEKLHFIKGSDYQLSPEYTMNVYTLMSKMSLHDAIKSGAEVVKQSKDPKMASLLYPGLQALDEEFLKVDAQFGGVDQRKIFMLADKYLPKLGYKKRIHLMNPMIPSFNSGNPDEKMSSSDETSKIDILDTPKVMRKKIGKAFCEEGNVDCGILNFAKHVIIPIEQFNERKFIIVRTEEYGGICEYENYDSLEKDFINKTLHPVDLKFGISEWLINLLEPVREFFNNDENQDIINKSY